MRRAVAAGRVHGMDDAQFGLFVAQVLGTVGGIDQLRRIGEEKRRQVRVYNRSYERNRLTRMMHDIWRVRSHKGLLL